MIFYSFLQQSIPQPALRSFVPLVPSVALVLLSSAPLLALALALAVAQAQPPLAQKLLRFRPRFALPFMTSFVARFAHASSMSS